jgi:hypothetical protein
MSEQIPNNFSGENSISLRLLDHDQLMTPVLMAAFGEVFACQTAFRDDGHKIVRRSALYRRSVGEKILDATLVISKSSVPDGFLHEFLGSEALFGQLLINHGIAVRIADRHTYRYPSVGGQETRWGRRLLMFRADDDALLCEVDELLVSEDQLRNLHKSPDLS